MNPFTLLIAVLVAAALPAQDTKSKTVKLVYEMPVDALQRSLVDRPDMDLEQLLAESVANVQARVPNNMKVTRGDATTFTVDVPNASDSLLALVRRGIETAGKLEMRMLAHRDYRAGDVSFDLAKETERLQKWLDNGGRTAMRKDTKALASFHDNSGAGPIAGANLRWFIRRIEPEEQSPDRWGSRLGTLVKLGSCVPAYTETDWNQGQIPAHIRALPTEQQFLSELIAINMHETFFSARDFDRTKITHVKDGLGQPGVRYSMVDKRSRDFADWSGKHVNECCALIWDDRVLSTPRFMTRIPGRGMISGVSDQEASVIARALRAPLVAKPRLLRMESR